MKKWILGLGAFALAFAMTVTPTDAKVMAAESTTVSAGDTTVSGGDTETNTKYQMDTPTGVTWGDSWNAKWNAVEGTKWYDVEIWSEAAEGSCGSYHDDIGWRVTPVDGVCTKDVSRYINGSGTYYFSIRSAENNLGLGWSKEAVSVGKEYKRPEKELSPAVGYWDNTQHGVFNIPVSEEVKGYEWELDCDERDDMYGYWTVTDEDIEKGVMQKDIYSLWGEKFGITECKIHLRAISADVNTIANDLKGSSSKSYNLSIQVENVKDIVAEEINNASTAMEAMSGIRSKITQDNLAVAMQNNKDVRTAIADLEQKFVTEIGFDIAKPVVSEAAGAYVKIFEAVGVGFSGKLGETVKLEVSVPEKKEEVSTEKYSKSVQLDIKLKSTTTTIKSLRMPITITMDVPGEIDANKLVILHYYEDGNYEKVSPLINEDGTITFTVTRFSTFVFAETGAGGNGGNTDGDNTGGAVGGTTGEDTTNNDNTEEKVDEPDDDEDESEEEVEEAKPVKDNVPKTGDSLPIAIPMTAAVILAGTAIALRRKVN